MTKSISKTVVLLEKNTVPSQSKGIAIFVLPATFKSAQDGPFHHTFAERYVWDAGSDINVTNPELKIP